MRLFVRHPTQHHDGQLVRSSLASLAGIFFSFLLSIKPNVKYMFPIHDIVNNLLIKLLNEGFDEEFVINQEF